MSDFVREFEAAVDHCREFGTHRNHPCIAAPLIDLAFQPDSIPVAPAYAEQDPAGSIDLVHVITTQEIR